jgi:hypothetical protein
VPPAQQFAPQAEVPYAADAYQAVMGSAPLLQVHPSVGHSLQGTAYASMKRLSAFDLHADMQRMYMK